MSLLIALICGVLGYFIAHLVFNGVIATLIGVVIFLVVAFGYDGVVARRP